MTLQDLRSQDAAKSNVSYALQIGKWLESETDANSWVARSKKQAVDFASPGVSVNFLSSTTAAIDCNSPDPQLSFDPRIDFASLGLDVTRTASQPLFSV